MHFFNDEFGDVTKLLLLRRRTDIVGLKRPTGHQGILAAAANPPARKRPVGINRKVLGISLSQLASIGVEIPSCSSVRLQMHLFGGAGVASLC